MFDEFIRKESSSGGVPGDVPVGIPIATAIDSTEPVYTTENAKVISSKVLEALKGAPYEQSWIISMVGFNNGVEGVKDISNVRDALKNEGFTSLWTAPNQYSDCNFLDIRRPANQNSMPGYFSQHLQPRYLKLIKMIKDEIRGNPNEEGPWEICGKDYSVEDKELVVTYLKTSGFTNARYVSPPQVMN